MPSPVVRDAVISDFRRRVEAARRARAATLEDERDDDARVSASTRADPIRVGAFDALQRALWDGDGDGDGYGDGDGDGRRRGGGDAESEDAARGERRRRRRRRLREGWRGG